jgi:hypothetical protein
MIELPYSLVIEATVEPYFFCFYSNELYSRWEQIGLFEKPPGALPLALGSE